MAQRIRDVAPHAKIIAILRNPVERAFSHYLMKLRDWGDERPFLEAVIADSTQQPRGLGLTNSYVEFGFYCEAIKRYRALFGTDKVRVYLYEDFESNPAGVIKDLCEFLEISFYDGRFSTPTIATMIMACRVTVCSSSFTISSPPHSDCNKTCFHSCPGTRSGIRMVLHYRSEAGATVATCNVMPCAQVPSD